MYMYMYVISWSIFELQLFDLGSTYKSRISSYKQIKNYYLQFFLNNLTKFEFGAKHCT